MSKPRAFISFDFDNNKTIKDLFAGQAKNSRTPFNIEDWSSKKHLPQGQWEKLILEKINRGNMLIALIGKDTHNAVGVEAEIGFAKENNVPVFGVYVDGASWWTTLPSNIDSSRVIRWDWEEIANRIDRCMKEGKNK